MPETKEKIEPKLLEEHKPYVFPFTVGADPEFTVVSGTRPMHAEDIFKTFFGELKKGDHGFILPGGNIGWDNHPATGELRPNPGAPNQVVANLKLLFEEAHKRMPFVDLTTLTVAASTGGHIHLSVPRELNEALERKTPKWAAIERAIGTFVLMIMIGENTLSRELRRRGSNYGDLLDFRTDRKFVHPSGEAGYTLEVRGPTAEWVTTEKIALGVLSYMAIAWDSILSGKLENISSILFKNKLQAHDAVDPLLNNFANIQKLYLDKMRPLVRAHPAYQDYKASLELIMNPERVIAEKRKAHYCINEGWGFTTSSKSIPTNKFLNDEEIEEKTSKFPEQVIRNLSSFAWNEDLNVEQFATALSKRCIALGWKPQHEYFLFGMKKGLDALIIRNEEGKFVSGQEIIKNKEDLGVIETKFSRLGTKAAPLYGRVLHPRTGELIGEKDSRRVMIGIPYEMRRKNDIKPLIRLVLKFEKNPKAFGVLDSSSLPEGASLLKEALQKEEYLEAGIKNSLNRGERPREVDREVADAIREEARANEPEPHVVMSRPSLEAIANKLQMLYVRWISSFLIPAEEENIVESALENVTDAITREDLPEIADESLEEHVVGRLANTLVALRRNGSNGISGIGPNEVADLLNGATSVQAYLLCAAIGQRGQVSLEPRRQTFVSQARVTPRGIELATDGRTTRNGTADEEIIMDLLGISVPTAREYHIRMLSEAQGRWVTFRSTPEMVEGMNHLPLRIPSIGTSSRINPQSYMVNPDNALPHIWNA